MPATQSKKQSADWIAHVPPTLFGGVMGVSGLGLAWRRAEDILGWPSLPGDIVLIIGAALLITTIALYGLKALRFPDEVRRDVPHPVRGPFIAGLPLAILLQVPALEPLNEQAAHILYYIGASTSLLYNLYLFSRWYLTSYRIEEYNAIWLIPGVGSFIVAMTGAPLGYIEISWLFFSIGIGMWIFLGSVLMYKYVFTAAQPDALLPSFFVPIVPPGLMSMIYPMLVGEAPAGEAADFTRFMYYFAFFLLLLNLAMIRTFLRLRFSMGWWAYSFPLDTITSATLEYAHDTNNASLMFIGEGLLLVTTAVISMLLILTIRAVLDGKVFAPEPRPARARG